MKRVDMDDLQASIRDTSAFNNMDDYREIALAFLDVLNHTKPTRIVSPTDKKYIFFQYGKDFDNRITRPLNTDLFIENKVVFNEVFDLFEEFLDGIKSNTDKAKTMSVYQKHQTKQVINRAIYTSQQAIGCIGDSFSNPNQCRKRIGQLFEEFVGLSIRRIGLQCSSRTIRLPIPGFEDENMTYELDLVVSKNVIVMTREDSLIDPKEIIGSVKTTSKDRLDKVFLDKYFLSHLLKRDVPVMAVFLHDVQRAQRGNSIFGINSTFKTGHFLFYTTALNRLDGVFYVDPRPVMHNNRYLQEQIKDFEFLLTDAIWNLLP